MKVFSDNKKSAT